MRFNFSGIDTSSAESAINGFKMKIIDGIEYFAGNYNIKLYENGKEEAEDILNNFFRNFRDLVKISV